MPYHNNLVSYHCLISCLHLKRNLKIYYKEITMASLTVSWRQTGKPAKVVRANGWPSKQQFAEHMCCHKIIVSNLSCAATARFTLRLINIDLEHWRDIPTSSGRNLLYLIQHNNITIVKIDLHTAQRWQDSKSQTCLDTPVCPRVGHPTSCLGQSTAPSCRNPQRYKHFQVQRARPQEMKLTE